MKLFKYIKFCDFTFSPLQQRSLHFSTIAQLRSANDESEFVHCWDTDSFFFKHYGNHMHSYYSELFNNTAVLCMSKSLSAACWAEFCPDGGVCYEFEYEDAQVACDLTLDHVDYCDVKNFNVPSFIIVNVSCSWISGLLSATSALRYHEGKDLMDWLKGEDARKIALEHILKELTFKKIEKHRFEDEFRYVHLSKSIGKLTLKSKLVDSKLDFGSLGLHLVRVHTSDVQRVQSHHAANGIQVVPLTFG